MMVKALQGGYDGATPMLMAQMIYVAFWTGVMYWLCSVCSTEWAWIVLLFPLIFGFILFVLMETEILAMLGLRGLGDVAGRITGAGDAGSRIHRDVRDDDVSVHRTYRVYY